MRKKLLIGIGICVVISLIIVGTRTAPLSLFFQGLVQNLYQAPKTALYNFSVSAESGSELEHLKQENATLRARFVEIDHLKKDNAALKSQFEEEKIKSNTLIPASIVGFHGPVNNPQVIVINRGAQDNLKIGQAVIVGNSLVGIIDTISDQYSSVTVVTNSTFSTVAKTNENGALGVIKGSDDFILFDRVAITEKLEKGNTVLTRGSLSNQKGGIPPDLIVGKVAAVRKIESEPFQSAQIESLIDIGRLTRVFVLL